MLSFQRLDVYQRAIEFLVLTTELTESLPRGHAERADQLIRAAESVVRNIAEGAGRWSVADQRRHYQIACGSATESAACVEIAAMYGAPNALCEQIDALLGRVVQMLAALIRRK